MSWKKRDSEEDGLLLFHPMNHQRGGEKEVKDWRRDENLINRNIWSSMNKYWIFNLEEKSAAW